MFAESKGHPWAVVFAPAVALLGLDLLFLAGPTFREIQMARVTENEHAQAVANLSEEIDQLSNRLGEASRNESRLARLTNDSQPALQTVSAQAGASSFMRSLSGILEAFESRGVKCVSASTRLPESTSRRPDDEGDHVKEHLLLIGDYRDVLAAMEAIEAADPRVLAETLVMRRLSTEQPCRWELTFVFREAPQ